MNVSGRGQSRGAKMVKLSYVIISEMIQRCHQKKRWCTASLCNVRINNYEYAHYKVTLKHCDNNRGKRGRRAKMLKTPRKHNYWSFWSDFRLFKCEKDLTANVQYVSKVKAKGQRMEMIGITLHVCLVTVVMSGIYCHCYLLYLSHKLKIVGSTA